MSRSRRDYDYDEMAFSNLLNKAPQPQYPHQNVYSLTTIASLCNPAFTEAAFVSCPSDAYISSVRRLSYESERDHCWGESYSECEVWLEGTIMEAGPGPASMVRTASTHSNASHKSSRSQTVRVKPRRYASYMSSSASSISDKSLTSFPSLSPESPKYERPFLPGGLDGTANAPRKPSDSAPSIVASLTTTSPSPRNRPSLFDDAPLSTYHVPGSIHHANDEHIERLIARNGAVALVRQIAEDLAQRDAQMAALKRKAEGRERALRKIILESGLSNLDLETRLRAIETEKSASSDASTDAGVSREAGLEDLMSDAMSETVVMGELDLDNDSTIRAAAKLNALEDKPMSIVAKGWKDYIWGGTSKQSSRANSINEDAVNGAHTTRRGSTARKSVLQNGLFQPPESMKSQSRDSSQHSAMTMSRERKASSGLATLALKLVAGNTTPRDQESGGRGRANSTGTAPAGRTQSTASAKTTMSARPAPKPKPKAIPTTRRPPAMTTGTIRGPPERWDTMAASPHNITPAPRPENYGPVEMDTILPPDAQPPTLTHIYNNTFNSEFLTDRFGFIYDQRRKKRQREAAEKVRKSKRGSRVEMLSSARSGLSPDSVAADLDGDVEDYRPDTPLSLEEDGKPGKRWQDYLKIATFPTELLSHTPAGSVPAFEVMEGGEVPRPSSFLTSERELSPTREVPKSPAIRNDQRGFLPPASTAAAPPTIPVVSENATISVPITTAPPPSDLGKEDTEPVKLLLKQLGEVHDSLQREKTPRWNDFLRKVRAERKRDTEAAVAAQAVNAEARSHKAITLMPEASLADGEMIGIAGLGNKGKVGRAKWNEFKALVLGGIPVAYRAKIWAECSGASALKIPGYYEDLVACKEEDDDPAIVAQIQMDINRTLTDNIFFRKGPGVTKLNEVLLAYSRRNAEVGYCQGMNLITACLLLIMPTAEDAFWVLTSIIENILPRGYYDHQLLASRADQQVLRQYVTQILPKLSSHLDDLSIELEALTFQWFLSVFTDCLSAEALFRVWDVVFCTNDGSTFLFQVALALLKLNEQQLLQCSTPASVYTYINHQMTNHAISIDGLIHASEGLRKVVKRDDVETRRARAIAMEKNLIRQREKRNALRKAERIAAASVASLSLEQENEISSTSSPGEGTIKEEEELTVQEPRPVEDVAE